MKKKLFLSILLMLLVGWSYAQQRTISGIIRDASTQEPLFGASVVIKGSTKGVSTDLDGKYSISVQTGQILEITFIGYQTKEMKIIANTPTKLNIVLSPEEVVLDDVVVVGYGVTKKRDLAGSITSLKTEDIKAGVVTDMSQFLKGRASGVQVKQNSLEPGGNVSIRVRGASSVSAENEPLYVIDGFQTDNMSQISMDDIESIEILKDASTTAIYGARGANGVILITTKKGKEGVFNIEYSNQTSFKKMYNPWELLDAGETIALSRRLYEQDPTIASSTWTAEQAKYRGKGTDWLKETTRSTFTVLHQLSVSGGTERLSAFASASYLNEPGILLNTDYDRFGGRTNIQYKISPNIRTGANVSFSQSKKKFLDMGTISSDKNIMYRIFNLEPWKNKEGYDVFGVQARRPAVFEEMNGAQLYRSFNTMYATAFVDIDVLPSLIVNGRYTYAYDHLKTEKYYDRSTSIGLARKGEAFLSHEENIKHQLEAVATYHPEINDKNDLKIIAGTSYILQKGKGDETQAYGFASDVFSFKNIGAAKHLDWIGSGESSLKKSSFFGRAEYVFNNRYIINASVRADGSSVFGADYRWGIFPAASLAWHLGEENFMAFAKPAVSRLKLRTSYGLSGNDGIRFGLSQYQYSVRDVYVGGSGVQKGMYPSNPYNPTLRWETTSQWNIGADIAFLNGRIDASVDYYIKHTKDLLSPDAIHPSGGFPDYTTPDGRRYEYTAMMVNDGEIENRGIEFVIKSTNFSKENFVWNTSLNFAYNKSKVLKLNNGQARFQYVRPHGSYDYKEYIILKEGEPLSAIYGYVFDGVIQEGETYAPQPKSIPGDPKFKDLNGDGIIDERDRTVLGTGIPKTIIGLNNSFTYKDFDFSIFFEASLGGKMLNLTRIYLEDNNRLRASQERWTKGGRELTDANGNTYISSGYPSNNVPRKGYHSKAGLQYGSYINSRFVEDADFLKLRNIEVGYTIQGNKWNLKGIKNIRLSLGAQNLFTFTKYQGFDPDISTNGSSAIAQGLDLNSYPAYRMINLGVKLTF
ncbi:MAG: TonB-dependent receptor [Capnocytophaga sp.]|nr:TonB-dependent receptor [Capnocytophaga sp.]